MKLLSRKYQHFAKISWGMFPEVIGFIDDHFLESITLTKYIYNESLSFYEIRKK